MTGPKPVIYLVDDDESVRKALKRLLRSRGFDVQVFRSAEDFLRSRRNGQGCLLLDVRLPGMSGIELQQKLTAAGNPMPVIFITAHGNQDVRARAAALGAVALLEKPFEEHSLIRAIHLAVRAGVAPGGGFADPG